jgi:hypothetical protein
VDASMRWHDGGMTVVPEPAMSKSFFASFFSKKEVLAFS